jgi:endoglycosylceramidase
MASATQPGGPAWFVSEFGASSDPALVGGVTAQTNAHLVGWAYWSWQYYADPTGSAAESLLMADGRLRSTAQVLSQTYPEAVAGRPTSISFNPSTGAFALRYVPDHSLRARTVIVVPTEVHYPSGYCAAVSGGRIVSRDGSELLEVQNGSRSRSVLVTVKAGGCRS